MVHLLKVIWFMFDSVEWVPRKKNFLRDWLSATREDQGNVAEAGLWTGGGAEQSKIRGERLRNQEETLIDFDVSLRELCQWMWNTLQRQMERLLSVFFLVKTRCFVWRVYRLYVKFQELLYSTIFTIRWFYGRYQGTLTWIYRLCSCINNNNIVL